ncbi:MAG: nucleoside monophosphate kinase [Candidatus Krumholzibacteria bacterium]
MSRHVGERPGLRQSAYRTGNRPGFRRLAAVAGVALAAVAVSNAQARAAGVPDTAAFAGQAVASKKPLWLIFFGASGLDRGELAAELDWGVPQLSANRMMEAEITNETGLGRRIQRAMEQGHPVADAMVFKLVAHRISLPDCDRGFVLDAFPRSLAQARHLTEIMEEQGKGEVTAVYLTLPDEVLLARMLANKRTVETEEDVQKRLAAYHARMAPLIEYYGERGSLVRVNANQSVEAVAVEIQQALKGSR